MMWCEKNDVAVCVFGSKARSSHDFLSDKDVLLTVSEVSKAYSQAQIWSAEGWSVTVYSHSRLVHMASIGSLFVQLLKQVGRIQNDPNHWLGDLLNDFSPEACYAEDAESSVDLIRPLERIMPLKSGSHLASDGACMVAAVAESVYPDIGACSEVRVTPLLQEPEALGPDMGSVYDALFDTYLTGRETALPAWAAHSRMCGAIT